MAEEHFKSLDKENFDLSTPAGTDFFQRVNGGWMEKHPLTPEYSRYSQFNLLADTAQMRIKDIVTNVASTNPAPGHGSLQGSHRLRAGHGLRTPQPRRR